jgi:hypothetical protein
VLDGPASSTVLPAHDKADPTSFLGRTEELKLIRQLLVGGTARLLTLTGPAGVGKTRLASEAGKRFAGVFPNGVWFVDLTTIRDRAEVPTAIAESLGLPDGGLASLLERLSACLQPRETLLILDNFEQVLPAAPLLDTLLDAAPRLRLLVTSRELLHLRAEQSLPVPPFPLPDPAHLPPVDRLIEVPSVALFLQRAQRINPGFRLTDQNARAVAELCVRLDGLPLAVELAAARTQLLSPQMLVERLEQRLSILHWEAQDLPVLQHTLRSAIAWSYDLLANEEQVLAGGRRGRPRLLRRCKRVWGRNVGRRRSEKVALCPSLKSVSFCHWCWRVLVQAAQAPRNRGGRGVGTPSLARGRRRYFALSPRG